MGRIFERQLGKGNVGFQRHRYRMKSGMREGRIGDFRRNQRGEKVAKGRKYGNVD